MKFPATLNRKSYTSTTETRKQTILGLSTGGTKEPGKEEEAHVCCSIIFLNKFIIFSFYFSSQ